MRQFPKKSQPLNPNPEKIPPNFPKKHKMRQPANNAHKQALVLSLANSFK